MADLPEPVAWVVADDHYGAFAAYVTYEAAMERYNSASPDGPCRVVKMVPTLTNDEREAIAGIALVLKRLKVYPHAPGRTQEDDVNLLFEIAEGRR